MCLTDKIFLQTHVTFCEYLVFHEFKRNLYITLAKYLEQEGITDLLFSICLNIIFLSSELISWDEINTYNNVRDILYNTDVITNIVKSIVHRPVGKLV